MWPGIPHCFAIPDNISAFYVSICDDDDNNQGGEGDHAPFSYIVGTRNSKLLFEFKNGMPIACREMPYVPIRMYANESCIIVLHIYTYRLLKSTYFWASAQARLSACDSQGVILVQFDDAERTMHVLSRTFVLLKGIQSACKILKMTISGF